MATQNTNSWNRWQKLIIYRMDQQDEKLKKLDRIEAQLNGQKVKTAGLAAAVAMITGFLYHTLKG